MSLLNPLKKLGVDLPPPESEEGLTARDIMNKARSFYARLEECDSEISEYAESYFLNLLCEYPKSLCSRNLTENFKLLIALIYLESKPNPEDTKPYWDGFSYEDLSVIFDISKATVHEAIHQKEAEAKQLLEEAKLRTKAKEIALKQLVEEEKFKLKQNFQKETEKQVNEPNFRERERFIG